MDYNGNMRVFLGVILILMRDRIWSMWRILNRQSFNEQMDLVCESIESYEPAGGSLELEQKKIQMKEKRRFGGYKVAVSSFRFNKTLEKLRFDCDALGFTLVIVIIV